MNAPIGTSVSTAWSGWPSHVPFRKLWIGGILWNSQWTMPWMKSPSGRAQGAWRVDQPGQEPGHADHLLGWADDQRGFSAIDVAVRHSVPMTAQMRRSTGPAADPAMASPALCAETFKQARHQRQVHAACQVAVDRGERVERAVAEANDPSSTRGSNPGRERRREVVGGHVGPVGRVIRVGHVGRVGPVNRFGRSRGGSPSA